MAKPLILFQDYRCPVKRGMRRGVKAKTDMIVLHVVSPSPTQADHGDMGERIARGEFELPA